MLGGRVKESIIVLVFVFVLGLSVTVNEREARKPIGLSMNQAFAATSLDPSGGSAMLTRFLYYLFNGLPSSGDFTFFDDTPTDGLVGLVNDAVGSGSDFDTLMDANSITSCDDIPVTGSISSTSADGAVTTIAFSTGSLTVPSHFPASVAGETYEKLIEYTDDGTNTMDIEVLCDGTDVAAVYLRISYNQGSPTRDLEFHYHEDSSTSAIYIDSYQETSDDINFVARFFTDDGDEYSLFIVRWQESASSGSIVGVNGSATNNIHAINIITGVDDTNTSAINTDADSEECFDLTTSTGAASTDCATLGLSVGAPGTFESDGTTYSFTAASVSGLALPSL